MAKQRPLKTQMVVMRVTEAQKASIRAAADRVLKPITDFALEAILDAVKRTLDDPPEIESGGDRASALSELLSRARGGGSTGYRWAGRLACRLYPELAEEGAATLQDWEGDAGRQINPANDLSERDHELIGRDFVNALKDVLTKRRRRGSGPSAASARVPNRRMKEIGLGALEEQADLQAGNAADTGAKTPNGPRRKRKPGKSAR